MSYTGINAVHVTGTLATRGPGRRGAGTFPAGDAPRAAAGQLPPPAAAGHQAAPALAAAVRDLYIAVRALPGRRGQGAPGAVPAKIRQAAGLIGTAWQRLGGSQPAGAEAMPSGAGGVLRQAVHRAVTAWSRPVVTGPDRGEVIEGAMNTAHGPAAAAGYPRLGGVRADRLPAPQRAGLPGSCWRAARGPDLLAGRQRGAQRPASRGGPREVRDGPGIAHPGSGGRCRDRPPGARASTRAAGLRGRKDRAGNGLLTESAKCRRAVRCRVNCRLTGPVHGNSRDIRR